MQLAMQSEKSEFFNRNPVAVQTHYFVPVVLSTAFVGHLITQASPFRFSLSVFPQVATQSVIATFL